MKFHSSILVFALLCASCGDGEPADPKVVSDPGTLVTDTSPVLDIVALPDVAEEVYAAPPETQGSDVYEPPIIGLPCSGNQDCGDEAFCVETDDGGLCTKACIDECPDHWDCKAVSGLGADLIFLCTPRQGTSCLSCAVSDDCEGPTRCVGELCLLPCQGDGGYCPNGFVCAEAKEDQSNKPLWACTPEGDSGCCSMATKEATEACTRENDFGTCSGTRECEGKTGWTLCTADTPEEEACDNLDNDCDAATDENLGVDCSCGDGVCKPLGGETLENCPYDCKTCGDGLCSPAEGPGVCPTDCCGGCGDGVCLGYQCEESPSSCPDDCGNACGNETCDPGESPPSCPADCQWQVCGNGVCEPEEGGSDGCPIDCTPTCGNCECEGGEDWLTCPGDCGFCGDEICSNCPSLNETPQSCKPDCCESDQEFCSGADDDCDGFTDEGFTLLGEPCDGADSDQCATGTWTCTDDKSGLQCVNESSPDIAEVCDEVDHDCDGATDEGEDNAGCENYFEDFDGDNYGNDLKPTRCLCKADAPNDFTTLQGGDCNDTALLAFPGAAEACNNQDDDCDDTTDEALGELTCGLGVCEHSVAMCAGGALQSCDPFEGKVDELCDQLDNDCDDEVDEAWADLGAPCDGDDEDLCENGTWTCASDNLGLACVNESDIDTTERCDAVDNDCDGSTDEAFPILGAACDSDEDVDQCPNGTWSCAADGLSTECLEDPEDSVTELCNGQDDDCDEAVDESFPEQNIPCDTTDSDLCANGVQLCIPVSPFLVCDESGAETFSELCNEVDDDCDGAQDEGFDVGAACDGDDTDQCENGTRTCASDGSASECVNESLVDVEEVCDTLDNDCDEAIDESFPGMGDACGDEACSGELICDGGDEVCDHELHICTRYEGCVEESVCGDLAASDLCATHHCPGLNDSCESAPVETCDTLDNDCNGEIDEGMGVGESCGVGVCADGLVQCGAPDCGGKRCGDSNGDGDINVQDQIIFGTWAASDQGYPSARTCEFWRANTNTQGTSAGVLDEDDSNQISACITFMYTMGDTFVSGGPCDTCASTQCTTMPGGDDDASGAEVCDQLDNDCDGHTDEDWAAIDTDDICDEVDNDCDGNTDEDAVQCIYDSDEDGDPDDSDCDDENPAIHHGAMEICDGIDNDCDNKVDGGDDDGGEGSMVLPECEKQYGVCEGSMRYAEQCVGGELLDCNAFTYQEQASQQSATYSETSDGAEGACDGFDNDCDGMTDEDMTYTGPHTLVEGDHGTCTNDPQQECGTNQDCPLVWSTDGNGLPISTAGECIIAGVGQPCGSGVCSGGTLQCAGGQLICDSGSNAADHDGTTESNFQCNMVDDDCDGKTDEDAVATLGGIEYGGGLEAPCGVGECSGNTLACYESYIGPSLDSQLLYCVGLAATDEICDQKDNDCDGLTDEDAPQIQDQDGPICDNIDDDCDGITDEGVALDPSMPDGNYVTGVHTPCGSGACADGGITQCIGGVLDCSTRNKIEDEACNTIDDDCDGDLNEGIAEASAEETCNGLDENCNGEIDENLQPPSADKHQGICAGQPKICGGADGWQEPDYALIDGYQIIESLCDSADNDCDGDLDEGSFLHQFASPSDPLEGPGKSCGLGKCSEGVTECNTNPVECGVCGDINHDGQVSTADSTLFNSSLSGTVSPPTDACAIWRRDTNGDGFITVADRAAIDNKLNSHDVDGDGELDEGVIIDTCSTLFCSTMPGGSNNQSEVESCNNLDDDCDGKIDEDTSAPTTCGYGPCTSTGTSFCENGVQTDTCQPLSPNGQDTCGDDLDQDCDGVVGSDDGAGDACGTGVCVGVKQCNQGQCGICGDIDGDGQAFTTDDNALFSQYTGNSAEVGHVDGCTFWRTNLHGSDQVLNANDAGKMGASNGDNCAPALCPTMPGGSEDKSGSEACDELDNDCDGLTDEGWNCNEFSCNEAAAECRTMCTSHDHCASTYYCTAPNCVLKTSSGSTCSDNAHCISGYCNSGYCS